MTFLPPYSPDYNPIEHSWANMKRFLRITRAIFAPSIRLSIIISEFHEIILNHYNLLAVSGLIRRCSVAAVKFQKHLKDWY
ncbi:MAG: transposase [Spirochaetaceae bacterium]|nr:transposase [Spirochaetaceae bacterium]